MKLFFSIVAVKNHNPCFLLSLLLLVGVCFWWLLFLRRRVVVIGEVMRIFVFWRDQIRIALEIRFLSSLKFTGVTILHR